MFTVRDASHDVADSGVEGLEEKELATVIHRIGDDLGGWLQVSNNNCFLKSLHFIERKPLRYVIQGLAEKLVIKIQVK